MPDSSWSIRSIVLRRSVEGAGIEIEKEWEVASGNNARVFKLNRKKLIWPEYAY